MHYLFLFPVFLKHLGMAPRSFVPICLEYLIEGVVILRATARQHLIGVLHISSDS